jgi:hypothetical protein
MREVVLEIDAASFAGGARIASGARPDARDHRAIAARGACVARRTLGIVARLGRTNADLVFGTHPTRQALAVRRAFLVFEAGTD